MKTKIYTTFLTMLMAAALAAQQQPTSINNKPASLPEGVSEEWYSQAAAAVQQMEYDFFPVNNNSQFRVANSNNRIGFMIGQDGYSVHNIQNKNDRHSWNVHFTVAGIGRENTISSFSREFVVIKKNNTVNYHSSETDVEYVNNEAGLRQNFIIHQKPGGDGELRIQLQLESVLNAKLLADNKLVFHTAGNENDIKLYYEDLKVWDANHQPVEARMELNENGRLLSLVVNDKQAAYPVTVDPLNRTPEWTTSADGVLPGLLNNLQLQVQTLYGYTVAGLGDVNGDNFDDVAVSAPGMADVVSGTGSLSAVGAVFVYFGSSTGLPVTPSRVLQPTTAVTGALFGFSVTGGDVTGDGINDVIVGAPLDRSAVDLGGGTGVVNATVGKIYIYQGGSFATSNPTPLLSLSLTSPLLSTATIGTNALFGFSLAVADDMNGDSKGEIVVGAPTYARVSGLSAVKTGGAFVFLSNATNTFTTVRSLEPPTGSVLGLLGTVQSILEPVIGSFAWSLLSAILSPLLNGQVEGLLFGFSVDGVGDYNNDGFRDVVVGAPAGVNLGSLNNALNGQILGGSAYVFGGTGNATGVNTAPVARLQATSTGLLGNAANLFGYKVKGVTTVNNIRNGNILVGAPVAGVLSNVVGGLQVKAGQVHVFRRKTAAFTNPVSSDQALSSPRASSILSILAGQTINVSMLFGSSMDNMLDVNCDGLGDIIVGEPMSSAVPLLGANVAGGAAYIFLGQFNGTYIATPFWDLTTTVSPLLGVNATALVGYSVAGARYTSGRSRGARALVGGPSNTLDFGAGLLNLGNTLGVTLSFVADNNGLGKAYTFPFTNCNITLPSHLLEFKGEPVNKMVDLTWVTVAEDNVNFYELQRSTDGSKYETIAMVFAKNAERNEYMYTDRHPSYGVNHYRLKTVDNNGQFTYSQVVVIRFSEKLPGDVIVAPNPVVSSDIKVRLIGLTAGNYRMELHNTAGQLLQTKTVKVSQYDQTETIMRSANMPSGIYWLNVFDDTHNRVKTVRVFMNNE